MSKRQRDLEVQKPQGEHREEMVSEMAAFKCRGRWKATGVGGGGRGHLGIGKQRVQEEEGLSGEARE